MVQTPDGATPPGAAAGSVPGGLLLGAIAFLGGAAVMTLELAAVRLLAPRFGDSAPVWTNTIGVILVALALGASLGGRLAAVGAPCDTDAGQPAEDHKTG